MFKRPFPGLHEICESDHSLCERHAIEPPQVDHKGLRAFRFERALPVGGPQKESADNEYTLRRLRPLKKPDQPLEDLTVLLEGTGMGRSLASFHAISKPGFLAS